MRNKIYLVLLVLLSIAFSQMNLVATTIVPQRFFVDFNSTYLTYVPSSKTLQITTEGTVLTHGSDWEKTNISTHLYSLKQNNWRNMYLRIDTKIKAAYLVRGSTTGGFIVSQQSKINDITVDVVGGNKLIAPTRFFLRFKRSYLVYAPLSKTLQITAGNIVLSNGRDWVKCQIKPYLYQFKQIGWRSFFWQVNTGRKLVENIRGGQFCKLVQSTATTLNVGVRVIN